MFPGFSDKLSCLWRQNSLFTKVVESKGLLAPFFPAIEMYVCNSVYSHFTVAYNNIATKIMNEFHYEGYFMFHTIQRLQAILKAKFKLKPIHETETT